jgi:UDP-glucose 4-epimerase
MNTTNMNILVTGGAGYIGSHVVVELTNAGYTPIIVDNFCNSEKSTLEGLKEILGHETKIYEGDCRDEKFMTSVFKAENIDGVIHFAALKAVGESVEKPLEYYDNNVGSLILLLKLMKAYGTINLVFSSSCTVYGQPDQLPVTELSPKKKAESPYGNTKQICEDIIEDTFKSGVDIKAFALRYFNPIGAHPSGLIGELPLGVPNNLVPFITQTAAGIREMITVYGNDYDTKDGTCIRDYIHVQDLAKAHVRSLEVLNDMNKSHLDFINIGSGKGNSVLEVIQTFEKVNSLKLNYQIGTRREGDVEKVYANASKSKNILSWEVEKTLEDSLKDAWNWQQKLS